MVGRIVGVACLTAVGIAVGMLVGDGLSVGETVCWEISFRVGVGVGMEALGVPAETGRIGFAASTWKLFVIVLAIPFVFMVFIVTVCAPGDKLVGGVQVQNPFSSTFTVADKFWSEWTVISKTWPGLPLPRKVGNVSEIDPSGEVSSTIGVGVACGVLETAGAVCVEMATGEVGAKVGWIVGTFLT